jgi:hypothetical protein
MIDRGDDKAGIGQRLGSIVICAEPGRRERARK